MANRDLEQQELELAQYHPSPPSSTCDEEVKAAGDRLDKPSSADADQVDTWWDSGAWKRFMALNFSFDGDAGGGDRMEHIEDAKSPEAMAAEVSSTITLFDAEAEADEVEMDWRDDGGSSASRSIIIGLDLPRDCLELPTSSHPSNGSEILSQILNTYLVKDSPAATGDQAMLLPARFNSGVTSEGSSSAKNKGPHQNDEDYMQPRKLSRRHHGNDTTQACSESALQRTIDDLIATNILISRQVQREAEGDEPTSKTREVASKDITPLIEQLQRIETHNRAVSSRRSQPGTLPASALNKAWIRERLQKRWQGEFKPALCTQLATLGAEHLRTVTNEPQPKPAATITATEKQLSRQRRLLTRAAKTACKQAQLHEITIELNSTLRAPLRDLERLHDFRSAQTHLLLAPHVTLPELLQPLTTQSDAFANTTALVEISLLDSKLAALASLVEMAQRTSSALETRINRLSAKDVPAGPERERTQARRLATPEALLYIARAGMDVAFIRESVRTVLRGMEHVEGDLSSLARKGVKVWAGWSGVESFMEEL